MFDPLFDVVTAILAWFYSIVPSYGAAIALLTLTAVVSVTPLTLKMTRNMLQMQRHMPELKKLQTQHKADRQALNEVTMAYYKEHGLNPVGCLLPMLVQGPIFLVMYRVVDGLTRRTTEIGTQLGFASRRFADSRLADSVAGPAVEYAETPITRGALQFDPDFLSRDSDLYRDLSADVEMVSFGVDLSRSASAVIAESVLSSFPYLVLLLIVLVTSLYQQRQIQGRQSNTAASPQQQMMMKLIPYMLPVFSYVMPAAVVTYFIVSNLVRIAQQAYITRSFYRGEDSLGAQVAKQRAADVAGDVGTAASEARSSRSITQNKGAPTPRRGAKQHGKAPSRKGTPATAKQAERRGRTGRAPSRSRSGGRPSGGRVTPPGSGAKRPGQNRSRSKKKRR